MALAVAAVKAVTTLRRSPRLGDIGIVGGGGAGKDREAAAAAVRRIAGANEIVVAGMVDRRPWWSLGTTLAALGRFDSKCLSKPRSGATQERTAPVTRVSPVVAVRPRTVAAAVAIASITP